MRTKQTQFWIRFLYRMPGCTRQMQSCPVCGSAPDRLEFQAPYSALDHCPSCDHVYSRRAPGKLILHHMYRDLDYWVRDKEHQGITRIAAGEQWKGYIDARMGALRRAGAINGEKQKIFEIGCSEGMLLHELQNLGHQTIGCECNRPTAEAGMKSLGVKIEIGMFEELALPRNYYDYVISFHTIEHIPDLGSTFARIREILTPEGTLLIEVPTGPEEYGNSDHVQFFSETSLRRLMEKHFEFGEVFWNRYTNAEGTMMGSLYGVGRRPRKQAS
ncbi:MAG: class I SAM-dependent methyltransferase [Sulfuritalea sp.]|jgi:2-polyprenyl-3-methyl-5-hydroxy-6-metoxy-1,4-benzoquinol methylase|nr:class I SAM-dependent methyltransferase [Sulfuritalea sp.]